MDNLALSAANSSPIGGKSHACHVGAAMTGFNKHVASTRPDIAKSILDLK